MVSVIAIRSGGFSGSGTLSGTSFPLIRKTGGSPTFRCTSEAPCFAAARRISFSSKRSRSFRRRLAGRHDPAFREDLLRQVSGHLRMLLEEQARVLPPLPDPLPADRVPRAALLDDVLLHAEVEDIALAGDPFPVEDVELRLAERRGEFVFHHLDPRAAADHGIVLLDLGDPADVQPNRGVELERVPPGGGLGIAEHDPDLLPDLVDEDDRRPGFADPPGELAKRLGHEARLKPHVGVPHLPLDLRLRNQRGDGVDHQDVERAAADQHFRDLEGLLPRVGLGDQEGFRGDPKPPRISEVEGVLRVDEPGDPPRALRLGDDVQGERGLAGRLRPEDLRDPSPRDPADAERGVEGDRAGGDDGDVLDGGVRPQPHDGSLAVIFLDRRDGHVERLAAACILGHGSFSSRRSRLPERSRRNSHRGEYTAPPGPRRLSYNVKDDTGTTPNLFPESAWTNRSPHAGGSAPRLRPTVMCGWNGRSSRGNPASERALSIFCCNCLTNSSGSRKPTQRIRGLLVPGNAPPPSGVRENGSIPEATACIDRSTSAARSGEISPRKNRVMCRFCGAVHATVAWRPRTGAIADTMVSLTSAGRPMPRNALMPPPPLRIAERRRRREARP